MIVHEPSDAGLTGYGGCGLLAGMSGLDLFISYSGKDRQWAVWLDFELQTAGHRTTTQEYDFLPGQSFVEAMDQALKANAFVVCLLSPPYLASRWCKEEWQAALCTQKLFLLRIAECELDGVLAPHAYVDLVGVAEAEVKARVSAALAKLAGKDPRPATAPAFPGAVSALAQGPRFPGMLPAIWNTPEARNPYFTGRDEILRRLHESLGSGQHAALTQAISGLGGVGKTQLALEYAYRHANEYEGVWWLRAESPATLADDYAALAPRLGVELVADQGAMIREVRARLMQRPGMLLIFDNATAPATLKPYLPTGPGQRVIVTTRAQYWPGATEQEVRELELDQAVKFLHERTGQTDRPAAEEVAQRLGCLPLALEQAAAYVVKCRKSLGDYGALLKQRGLEVLEKGQPYNYEQTVGTTWDLAFEKVNAEHPAAVDLLYLCAFLAPEAIHLKELAGAKDKVPEALSKVLADEVALDEAKAALLEYSLIRSEAESISIHRLVSEVIRKRMPSDEQERWLRAALQGVNEAFPSDSDDVRTWPQCSRWLAHALTVVAWDLADKLAASACSRLLNQAGGHLWAKASYSEAEPLYRRALAIYEQSPGPNHPYAATALNNLARLLRNTNRQAEAEPLFRRALAILERSLGPNHPKVAICLGNLALLLQATDGLAEAEPLFRRALAIDEQSCGPNHPEVATDLNNLALLLQATHRLAEAEQSLGPNHPNVATALNNLALLLQATHRLAEAEPLLRRALAIAEQSLGLDHPTTLLFRKNLERLLANLAAAKS